MVDLLLIFFFFFCLIRGILRGTVKEACSIAGIFSGLIIASAYYEQSSRFIFGWIDKPQISHLWGFLLTFGIIYFFLNFLGIMLINSFHIANSGVGSRISGAAVGIIKGLLLISVLLIPMIAFSPNDSKFFKSSTLFSIETSIAKQMIHVTTGELQKKFEIKIMNYKKPRTL